MLTYQAPACPTDSTTQSLYLQLLAIVVAGISGAVVGDQLHGSVSDALVVRIILVLLLMGSVSMIVDLKGGSVAANVLVGCMACITIGQQSEKRFDFPLKTDGLLYSRMTILCMKPGGLLLLVGRYAWLHCCGVAVPSAGEPML